MRLWFALALFLGLTRSALAQTGVLSGGSVTATGGSTSRTLANFTTGVFCDTPMAHGAVGNGTTDDTAAVQAAITANQGGVVYLERYLYLVGPLTSAGPITIIGAGGGQGIYNQTCTAGLRVKTANTTLLTLSGSDSLWHIPASMRDR